MKIKCKSYPSTIQIFGAGVLLLLLGLFLFQWDIYIFIPCLFRDIQMNDGKKKNVLTCNWKINQWNGYVMVGNKWVP